MPRQPIGAAVYLFFDDGLALFGAAGFTSISVVSALNAEIVPTTELVWACP